jgi:hypothetical protein
MAALARFVPIGRVCVLAAVLVLCYWHEAGAAVVCGLAGWWLERRVKSLAASDALFDVRVDHRRSQVWTNWTTAEAGGPKVRTYHLLVELMVRFGNGDTAPRIVDGVRLALFRRRRFWPARHLADSHLPLAYMDNGAQPIELTAGLSVSPESLSEPYTFSLYSNLPRGVCSLDETHFAVVSFQVRGRLPRRITVPLLHPQPHGTFDVEPSFDVPGPQCDDGDAVRESSEAETSAHV